MGGESSKSYQARLPYVELKRIAGDTTDATWLNLIRDETELDIYIGYRFVKDRLEMKYRVLKLDECLDIKSDRTTSLITHHIQSKNKNILSFFDSGGILPGCELQLIFSVEEGVLRCKISQNGKWSTCLCKKMQVNRSSF